MSEVSNQIRMRNRLLALAATGFLFWQAMQALEDLLPASGALFVTLTVLGLAGIAGFVAAIGFFLVYANRVTQADSQAVIEDELFRHNQSRALRAGYIALMVLVAAGTGAVEFIDIPATQGLRALMVTGVCVPIFTFLWLDRSSGDEDAE